MENQSLRSSVRKVQCAMRGPSLSTALAAINALDELVAVRGSSFEIAVRARVELWCVRMRNRAHARTSLR